MEWQSGGYFVKKGVLGKATYLMPICTVPTHSGNFKGSEKFCNSEICRTLFAPELSKPLTLGHFLPGITIDKAL